MCGLIGFTGANKPNLLRLSFIMNANDSRGGHSSGLMLDKKIIKTVGTSTELLPELSLATNDANIAIGHTRYATHGKQTAENSHPFKYGSVVGAHNGVLSNYEEVCKAYGLEVPDVDSKTIFSLLNKTKDYSLLGKLDGTIAVLFTDKSGDLFVYRRNNPLFMCQTEEGLYFSSIENTLNDISEDVVEVEKDVLLTYRKGELVEVLPITYDPIESTKIVNTDWSSYGANKYNKVSDYYADTKYDHNEIDYWSTEYSQAATKDESPVFRSAEGSVEELWDCYTLLNDLAFNFSSQMTLKESDQVARFEDIMRSTLIPLWEEVVDEYDVESAQLLSQD
jgi:glucosamine 6-phosphate synthetase-like amidotransferase/phosphosugar isomerase protein|tara:strand:+ start:723 stop:1730 length:1008 start_codon:yes stop_codon:yes gene_type:complete